MTLPQGWDRAPIGDLCDLINGKAFKPSDWSQAGLPIIRIQNLNKPDAEYNFCDFEVDEKFIVENGELLFAWSGTPGTSFGAHVWTGPKAVLNQHIFRVRFDEEAIDRDFFKRAINSTLGELIGKAHGGVGLAHVTKGKFEETAVPFPPYAEQRRIVGKLDALTARLARARAQLDRVPVLAKRLGALALDDAFALDERGTVPMRELLEDVRYGTSQKCDYDGGDSPVLRIPNVQAGRIDLSDLKSSTFTAKELAKLALQAGDVLVIRSNGSLDLVGKSAVVENNAVGMLYAGYLIRLRPMPGNVVPRFLHHFLSSPAARTALTRAARSTSGVNNVNAQQLQALAVPVRSVEEQQEIVHAIDDAFARVDRMEAEAARARALIDRLEAAILDRAFCGDLVPQDPNDEPASVLLDRIRAQRAAAPKAKRGRRPKAG